MAMITQFINDIGNFIFIPVIFLLLMKLLGRSWSESAQSAMKVGIGFIALSMVVTFMLEKMQPAIKGLAAKTGSSLSAIDVGGCGNSSDGLWFKYGCHYYPTLCVY